MNCSSVLTLFALFVNINLLTYVLDKHLLFCDIITHFISIFDHV